MSPAERLALIRSLVGQGLTHAAIGARLGITVQHIGLLLRQARAREAVEALPREVRRWRPDASLMQEVAAARREMATAPLYRPARGLT